MCLKKSKVLYSLYNGIIFYLLLDRAKFDPEGFA